MDDAKDHVTGFSFVVPVRNESATLVALHDQITAEAGRLGEAYEIIYVNDGSSDETETTLDRIQAADECVSVVELSRPFGAAGAVTAGCAVARGKAVVTFDRRLSAWPIHVAQMVAAYREGFEIIHVGGPPSAPAGQTGRFGALLAGLLRCDQGQQAQMRMLDGRAVAAMQPAAATRTVDQQVGHVGFRQRVLPGGDPTGPALRGPAAKVADAPGRFFWTLLGSAAALAGGALLVYLVSLIALAAGADTGSEVRITALVAGLTGLCLALVALVGRLAVCASVGATSLPVYVVRRVLGPAAEAEPEHPEAEEPAPGAFAVYT